MAANIFHGAPGSFKSASAFWFEVLPALRAGRIVVTNIEGVLTKESIEMELDEVFPSSSDIWRLSSQTENGLYLWRRWFWWMPVKAFIIIDEVQDVFPNDAKVFKPEDLDSKGIESLKHLLPEKFYKHYHLAIQDFKPDLSEGTTDDTGQTILDQNGDILYPKLMREANMRHRKYNWDIIYCTPEITEIHKLVRSVCEFAYFHKYNESFEFIPYFKRRPRIHQHSPKGSGVPLKKGDPTKWRKVPLDVHKCYRSTSTGKITKTGALNAFKDPTLIFAVALLLLTFGYMSWYVFIKDSNKKTVSTSQKVTIENSAISSQTNLKDNIISSSLSDFQSNNESTVPLVLPFDATKIYMTGYQDVILNKDKKYKQYFFVMTAGEDQISINNHDLYYFGYKVFFINDCLVKIKRKDRIKLVTCLPKIITPIVSNNEVSNLDNDLTSNF
jgi:zona occludens toxin